MKLFISRSMFFVTLIAGNFITANVGLAHSYLDFSKENSHYGSVYAQFPGRPKAIPTRGRAIHDDDRREHVEEICDRRWDEDDLDDCIEEAREDRRDNWDDRNSRRRHRNNRDDRREHVEEMCDRRWDEDDLDDCIEEAREDRKNR
ncbi:MAG: hypothetical protein QNJ34_13600 [Xenococcaceae cyanobacterium MO_188.B29]|nr:hypothetical protein [Xenococcaceae cyanobacterium MO_188.B29]